jgi:nicotinamide-nucleotide amidase
MEKETEKNGALVEIITIGDEILIGQIVDTNSAWMGTELNKEGFRVFQITTVPDSEAQILEAVDLAFNRADIVLLTGGLGPTKDDITKQTLCKYFNTRLVFDQGVIDNINELFRNRPLVLNELTYGQANVPQAATIIQNKRGTAPVTWFDRGEKVLVSMPGVPSEMKWVMSNEILPRLAERFKTPSLMHQTVLVYGIPESSLAIQLTDWENELPTFIKLAYLPSPGLVKLRMTGFLEDRMALENRIQEELIRLRAILGPSILAEEDLPVETIIGNLLKDKNLKLVTAESCTGGNIAHMITSVAGSSTYFKGGVVAYSNEIKQLLLGVSPATLEEVGAVSQEVVEEMAKGALEKLEADVAVAVSGIAGPDGGTESKPVGTVWIAVCTPKDMISRQFQFGALRSINISRATLAAFAMIKEIIEK